MKKPKSTNLTPKTSKEILNLYLHGTVLALVSITCNLIKRIIDVLLFRHTGI